METEIINRVKNIAKEEHQLRRDKLKQASKLLGEALGPKAEIQ